MTADVDQALVDGEAVDAGGRVGDGEAVDAGGRVGDGEAVDVATVADIPRALEAILMIADEPQTLVSLATAVGAPIPAVRQAIEALVADYDGEGVRSPARLRTARGRRRLAHLRSRRVRRCRSRLRAHPEPDSALPGRARNPCRDRVQAADQPRLDRIHSRRQRRFGRAHAARSRPHHRGVHRQRDRRHPLRDDRLMLVQLGINSIDELPPISPLLADGSSGFDDLR